MNRIQAHYRSPTDVKYIDRNDQEKYPFLREPLEFHLLLVERSLLLFILSTLTFNTQLN